MFIRNLYKSIFLLILLTLSSCQTKSPLRNYQNLREGHWSTYVQITNKQKKSSYIVKMDINAYDKKAIRLDVTHTLKGHLASLVVKDETIKYLLIPQKRFYSGKVSSRSLEPLFSTPLHPHLLYNLLFKRPITTKGWDCLQNEQKLPLKCWNKELRIRWVNHQEKRQKIIIDHEQGRLQIRISKFRPKVQEGDSLFQLKKPKSFQHHSI